MKTLRDFLQENADALYVARRLPRTGASELLVRRLGLDRSRLVNQALSVRDRDAMSWLAVHGGNVNAEVANATGDRFRAERS